MGYKINRLNALIALRNHYLEIARHVNDNVKMLEGKSAQKFSQHELNDLDKKLREVTYEIDKYHIAIVRCRACQFVQNWRLRRR